MVISRDEAARIQMEHNREKDKKRIFKEGEKGINKIYAKYKKRFPQKDYPTLNIKEYVNSIIEELKQEENT